MHHFIVHVAFRDLFYGDSVSLETSSAAFVNGFLYSAVNCFILISGYFGIEFKWRGLMNIYLILLFYGLIDLFASVVFNGQYFTLIVLKNTLLCFSHSKYWFIQCYIALYMMAPLINRGLHQLTKKEYALILLLFSIINLYLGYYWHNSVFNLTGFTTAQFVFLYVIGGFLRQHVSESSIKSYRWASLAIYIFTSLLWGTITIVSRKTYIPHWYPWGYNNPVIVVSAIAFLCFWLSLEIKSNVVNYMAKGCLSVYILHSSTYLGENVLYGLAGNLIDMSKNHYGLFAGFVILAFLAMLTVIVILFFDCLRRLLMQPIWSFIDKWS